MAKDSDHDMRIRDAKSSNDTISCLKRRNWEADSMTRSGWLFLLSMSLPLAACSQASAYTIKDSGVLLTDPILALNLIAWLDSTHVVISGESIIHPPVDKPEKGPRVIEQGLYIWDTQTNTVTKHEKLDHKTTLCVYEGVLTYRRKGMIVIWTPAEAEQQRPLPHPFWFNPFSCRYYDSPPPWEKGGRTSPLLEEHGYIDLSPPAIDEERPALLYRPGATQGIPLSLPVGVGGPMGYSPLRHAYLFVSMMYRDPITGKVDTSTQWPEGKPIPIWWLTPEGTVTEEVIPYHPMARSSYRVFLPVKGGLFVYAQDIGLGTNIGHSGGYLARAGTVKKLIAGLLHNPVASSDGCRVAFVHEPQFPTDQTHRNTLKVKMIDLCDGGTHE